MSDFDFKKLLGYFDKIKGVKTTEVCPTCRGSGTDTYLEQGDAHRSSGMVSRPCTRCGGEGRIKERDEVPERKPMAKAVAGKKGAPKKKGRKR